jgi:hypothetical protein
MCRNRVVESFFAHSQVEQNPGQSAVDLSACRKGNRFGTIAYFYPVKHPHKRTSGSGGEHVRQ